MTITGLKYRLEAYNGNLAIAKDDRLVLPHGESLVVSWVRFILDVEQPFYPFMSRNQQISGLERLKSLLSQKCGRYISFEISIVRASRNNLDLEIRWKPRFSTNTPTVETASVQL